MCANHTTSLWEQMHHVMAQVGTSGVTVTQRMEGMFFSKGVIYILLAKCLSHLNMNIHTISKCCDMLHAQKRLQQTQKPSFYLCRLTLTYKKQASTNFFPVDSHDNVVSQRACKNWSEKCVVWAIGVAFKHHPENPSFFYGFSTGFYGFPTG